MRSRVPALLLLASLVLLAPTPATADPEADLAVRVREAFADGGAEAVKAAVDRTRADLWRVVERLAGEGAFDGAAALARIAKGSPLYARLPDYVAWRRAHPPAEGLEARLVRAGGLRRAGRLEEALAATEGVLEAADGVTRVRTLRLRAVLYEKLHRSADVVVAAHREAAEAAGDLGWTAAAMRTYAWALARAEQAGAPESVLLLAGALLPLARSIGVAPLEQQARSATVRAYRTLGRYEEALQAAEAEVASARGPVARRAALVDLLVLLVKTRRPQRALRLTAELQELERRLGNENGVMACEVKIASIEASMGRLLSALARIQKALSYYEEHGTPAQRRGAHMNAAKVWLHLRDGTRSLEHVHEARAAGADEGREGGTLYRLEGGALYLLGRLPEAVEAYRAALPDARREPRSSQISLHLALAHVLSATGAHEEAAAELRAARALGEGGTDPLTRLYLETSECAVRLQSGDVDGAIAAGEDARRYVRAGLATEWYALLESRLARAHLQKGEAARALACAERAIETTLRSSGALPDEIGAHLRAELASTFALGVAAAAARGDVDAVFRIAEQERAVALRTHLSVDEIVRRTLAPELRTTELALEDEVREAVRAYRSAVDGGSDAQANEAREVMYVAREALERHREHIRARQAVAGHALSPAVDDRNVVQARLGAGEALVVYAAGISRLWALVLRHEGVRLVPLGGTDAVRALGEETVLEDATAPADDDRAALVAALVTPLGLAKDVSRVLVVPTGTLAWIPFPALLGGRDVVLLPSATVARMLAARPPHAHARVLSVGDPGGAFGAALGGAVEEARTVGDRVLAGEAATEENLRRALDEGPWHGVHVACHGLMDPYRPLRSALSLRPSEGRDGLWTVSEILGARVRADLVALSACSAGRDRIFRREGGVGFVHAFFVAGAKRVLVSLWNVDDRATAELMKRFYAAWTPGTSAAAALRAAQRSLREQPRFAHPAYWAGWVLWGVP